MQHSVRRPSHQGWQLDSLRRIQWAIILRGNYRLDMLDEMWGVVKFAEPLDQQLIDDLTRFVNLK